MDVGRNPELSTPLPPLNQTLLRCRERVERALAARLPPVTASPTRLHQAMRYAVLDGGKRVRAGLVYAAGAALGANEAALDPPACAIELIHAYSLVHDDLPCMDDDDLRRGKPSCHKAYDEGTALLAGDALQTLAFEMLAHDPALTVGPAQRLEMITTLARAAGAAGMAGGQAIDLAAVGRKLPLAELQDMHARKTGALIHAGVRLGALAAGTADAEILETLDRYGRAVGLAFQIADDILDVEGEAEALGKRPGADQARNKPTYPALLGLDEAKTRAQALLARALESLAPLGDNGAVLAALARYIVERRQ
jgi:geranylgeranyl pyrophosphate synthase